MSVKVLALDLERTLIDDALSARPRPGLRDFLAFCDESFTRVAIYTTVEETDAREVIDELAREGHVTQALLARLEYIDWSGEHKDLAYVPGVAAEEVVLVDDDAGWIRPDQRGSWVAIKPWDGGPDGELPRIRSILQALVAGVAAPDA